MEGKPTGYKYEKCKDNMRWNGIKPKDYIPLIDKMFREFVKNMS